LIIIHPNKKFITANTKTRYWTCTALLQSGLDLHCTNVNTEQMSHRRRNKEYYRMETTFVRVVQPEAWYYAHVQRPVPTTTLSTCRLVDSFFMRNRMEFSVLSPI